MANLRERLQNRIQDRFDIERGDRILSVVERQTSRVPARAFLALAVASLFTSIGVAIFSRRKEFANFVGLWTPTLLLVGIYNKLVHIERGEESVEHRRAA